MNPSPSYPELTPLKPYFSQEAFTRLVNARNPFFEALSIFEAKDALEYLYSKDASSARSIENLSEIMADVPAYAKFKNDGEFMDKSNYLSVNTLTDLVPEPAIEKIKMLSVSSGSSGKPSFWPRGNYLELETTLIYELALRDFFEIDKKKTLVIVGYSMGMYVAGVFTLNACLRIAQRGYPLSVITPGISQDNIIRIIQEIGDQYEQIVLCGYPPFVKDIVEEGTRQGINWSDRPLKFIFGAESLSEEWRAHLYKRAHITDYYRSSFNTYGSADAAILGHETPLSILIKQICTKDKVLLDKLFGGQSVSTFVQYHPALKEFQEKNGELILSTIGGAPLYQYNLHDSGKVMGFDEMVSILKEYNIDILAEANRLQLPIWKLPFVVLFGKSDQTITLYGLNIYPQTVRAAIDETQYEQVLTGRLQMRTRYNRRHNQYIEVNAELESGHESSRELTKRVQTSVFTSLMRHNYEYRTLYEKLGKKVKPKIILSPYGTSSKDRGSKQKWIG